MLLSLEDREFWRMSPRAFAALMDVYREREEDRQMRADYRAGVIAAEVRNKLRGSAQPPVRPSDFFASLKRDRGQTPEEMYHAFMGHVLLHNARRAAEA